MCNFVIFHSVEKKINMRKPGQFTLMSDFKGCIMSPDSNNSPNKQNQIQQVVDTALLHCNTHPSPNQ